MTDLSGITITTGFMPSSTKENLIKAVERIGAKIVEGVRIDTTHFVTTEGRGQHWEKAVEGNIPVVRPEWVDACEKSGRILGVTKFYLDAMKPGLPEESQPQPTPPPPPEKKEEKDLPAPPAPKGESVEKLDEDDKRGNEEQNSSDTQSSSEDDDDEEEPEQKARLDQQEEQKVRLEDKEEQKVALFPGGALSSGDKVTDEKDQDSKPARKDNKDDADAKTAPTPDGSSFQEVEL